MQPSVAIGGDAEIPALEDVTDEEAEVTSASKGKETTSRQCKVLLPVSSLVVHKIYCATLGNVARVYPWIVQGLTFLAA